MAGRPGPGPANIASPDLSVPSVTETSYASSPEDEAKLPSARRTLFKMEDEEEKEYTKIMTLAESTRVEPSPSKVSPNKYETVLVGEKKAGPSETASIIASTTSSETTAIPSWNLSQKEAEEREIDGDLKRFMLSPPSPNPVQSSSSTANGWKQTYHTLRGSFLPSRFAKEPGLVFEEARPFYAEKEASEDNAGNRAKNVQEDTADKKASPVMVEEPPEPYTSCSTALNLTPAQLAEIFLAFGQTTRESSRFADQDDNTESSTVATASPSPRSMKRTPDNDKHPTLSQTRNYVNESPAVVETPRIRSLERENCAFRKIVEQDAHTIVNLQRALETLKQLCALKEVEIVDRQTELQISEDRIARLKKERADFSEREMELLETIKILKQEVDKMTLKAGNQRSPGEIETIEAELVDEKSQNCSHRTRIAELESALKERDEVMFNLRTEIDYLKSQMKEANTFRNVVDCDEVRPLQLQGREEKEASTNQPVRPLAMTILYERLDALERDNMQREGLLLAALNRANDEMERIRLQKESDAQAKDTLVQVSEDPQEIETTAVGDKASQVKEETANYGCCCSLVP